MLILEAMIKIGDTKLGTRGAEFASICKHVFIGTSMLGASTSTPGLARAEWYKHEEQRCSR